MNNFPLSKYTVLDFTVARAGPTAVRLLSDWGARVIRVDPLPKQDPGSVTGKRRGSDEQNLHRNKKSICLDLKSVEGRAVLNKLVASTDVVVENFRSDVKERLGLTYDQLRKIKEDIVLASISGFGQDGPYSKRPGVDQIVQGMSGLMSVTGEPGSKPTRVGIAISDTTSGMFLGQAILLALLHRAHTGEGQWVHTSLLESMLNKLDFQASRYTVSGDVAEPAGNFHPTLSPMGTYDSKDGMVNISAVTTRMWENTCNALGANWLLREPEYATRELRFTNRMKLNQALNECTQTFTSANLVDKLNAAGVPCGPVYNIAQAFEDPQGVHLRMTRPAEHPVLGRLNLLRSPFNLSKFPHPESFECAAPDPGQDSQEILREFGYDDQAIDELRKAEVVI